MSRRTALGRLALRRVEQRIEPVVPIAPAAPDGSVAWSRQLWGVFLPERRKPATDCHRPVRDRRRLEP